MREERRQPKYPEIVEIPENLSSFLAEVHQMILDNHEETAIESDDLLQCEFAYGGLKNSQTGIYSSLIFLTKKAFGISGSLRSTSLKSNELLTVKLKS